MAPPSNDIPIVQQHPQASPHPVGRHVKEHQAGKIPQSLLQQIKSPPKHQRNDSLAPTYEEEVEESFHNLEDDDFGLKQT